MINNLQLMIYLHCLDKITLKKNTCQKGTLIEKIFCTNFYKKENINILK